MKRQAKMRTPDLCNANRVRKGKAPVKILCIDRIIEQNEAEQSSSKQQTLATKKANNLSW